MSDVSGEFCGWWKARGASVRAFYGVACAGGELLEVEQAATCGEEEMAMEHRRCAFSCSSYSGWKHGDGSGS